MLKKIFLANFEESLNLQDDSLISYMEQPDSNKRHPFLLTSLIILGIIMLYGISILTTNGVKYGIKDSPVPTPKINLLTTNFFWVCLVIWVSIWLLTKIIRYPAVNRYFAHVNAVTYLIWLVLEINLFLITFILKPIGTIGTISIYIFILLAIIIIIRVKKKSLENLIYGDKRVNSNTDKFINKLLMMIVKYGSGIIAIYMILRIFLFDDGTNMNTIFLVILFVVFDIGISALCVFFFFPFILVGYYKYKYSEEYREWENKTPEQWYGNKYLKNKKKEE